MKVAAAVAGVTSIASRIISEPTRRSYTQVRLSLCIHLRLIYCCYFFEFSRKVYNQISEYANSLNPPVKLDITEESIPPAIIISYMSRLTTNLLMMILFSLAGVLFTGKHQAVMDSQGVPVRQNNGQIRFGKEFAESTFRKVYHALQTLHVHFQQENEYKVFQV